MSDERTMDRLRRVSSRMMSDRLGKNLTALNLITAYTVEEAARKLGYTLDQFEENVAPHVPIIRGEGQRYISGPDMCCYEATRGVV